MKNLITTKSPITRTELNEIISEIHDAVSSGELSAMETFVSAKAIKEFADGVLKSIDEIAIDERMKISEKQYDILNVITSIVEPSKPKLNYDDDEHILELTNMLKQRKSDLDLAFERGKNGDELVINSEVVPIVSVKSYGKTYIKTQFKK